MVDFTKATAGSDTNLRSLLSLKEFFNDEMDLSVIFTKRPLQEERQRTKEMKKITYKKAGKEEALRKKVE